MANEKWSAFTDVGAPVSGDKIVGLHAGVNVQFDSDSVVGASPTQVQQAVFNTGIDTGVADAYVVACTPAINPYTEGLIVYFTPANTSLTTSPTLDGGAGGNDIFLLNGGDLLPGDIVATQTAYCLYLGSKWVLLNPNISYVSPLNLQENAFISGEDTGSVNAYIWDGSSFEVPNYSPIDGSFIVLTAINATNTGPSTLFIGGGTLDIITPDGNDLIGGEMIADGNYFFMYQVGALVLMNSSLPPPAGDANALQLSMLLMGG